MELREISTWRRNSNPPAYLHSEYMKSSRRGLSLSNLPSRQCFKLSILKCLSNGETME